MSTTSICVVGKEVSTAIESYIPHEEQITFDINNDTICLTVSKGTGADIAADLYASSDNTDRQAFFDRLAHELLSDGEIDEMFLHITTCIDYLRKAREKHEEDVA